jgi:two-component system, chemotaxis family, sensor kinase CheA
VIRALARYLILPREVSAFEARYLRRLNRIGLIFFALHVPVMVAIASWNGTGAFLAFGLSAAVVAGPALAYVSLPHPRMVSLTYGVAAMFMGGVLVHVGQGAVQIEMHFYFFALLAMLAVFGNPMVIVVAAITVALHHLALWALVPRSVFNYGAPIWVVAVHEVFVFLESVAACFIARSFFDNVIGLEEIVRTRTAELDARNRDMRLVLDHVDQGLATMDRRGVLSVERSQTFDRLFPSTAGGAETIFDLFGAASTAFAERSRAAWGEVTAALMPLALTLEQMPHRLIAGGRQQCISYMPIGEGDSPERFLVVVTDVTAETRRALAERDSRETGELFERLLTDRTTVETFFEEGAALEKAIGGAHGQDLSTLERTLHTLKGNSAVFGLTSLSVLCHDLESWIAESRRAPPAEVLAPFREHWASLVARSERLLGTKRHVVEIGETDRAGLERGVRDGVADETLLRMVCDLKLEPTQQRLEHFGEQAGRIARRLDKEIRVVADGHGLRVDPKYWSAFWSAFIHAVRNAVDHGLEPAVDRLAHGKPAIGTIGLHTFVRDNRFVVEIADDGPGIDWAEVARKATELGLPAATAANLRDALFCDGISTAADVTDVSGRGLGMGALRAATLALGGELEIETEAERGTTLRLVFPKDAMNPDFRPLARASTAAAVAN